MSVKGYYKKDGKTRPITEKKGKSQRSTGQTEDPTWKKSSIEDLKKDLPDERDDEAAYRSQAKRAPTPAAKRTLTSIADDEAEHQRRIEKLKKQANDPNRSKEVYTYHGRSGHPVIHHTEDGKEYIMVRAEGGGDKRLYLTPETKRQLESKKGVT